MQKITYECQRKFAKTLDVTDDATPPKIINNFVIYDSNDLGQIFCPECESCEKGENFMYQPKGETSLHLYKTCFVQRI